MKAGLQTGAAILLALAAIGAAAPAPVLARTTTVTVSEGTHLAFALSPDGKRIVIDLQGVLYVLPAGGGAARALTDPLFDARQPSFSPDGRFVAFQSNRDGHFRIWVTPVDGGRPRPLSTGADEEREPAWSPDGREIAFTSSRGGKFDIWARDVRTGALRQLSRGPGGNSRASWSPDGREVAYVSDRQGATGIYVVDAEGRERQAAAAKVMAFGMNVPMGTPTWSPDGKHVFYARTADGAAVLMRGDAPVITGEDVHPFRAAWLSPDDLLYAADGQLKRRRISTGETTAIPFTAQLAVRRPNYRKRRPNLDGTAPRQVQGVQRAALAPDGRQVAFVALGDLWVMPLSGPARRLTDGGPFVSADPAWSPDGRSIAFASDRAGSMDLWTVDVATGAQTRVTSAPGAELRPAWSPDGARLVYVDAKGSYVETVRVRTLATGEDREIQAAGTSPGYPAFTPDGQALLVAALRNISASQSFVVGGLNGLQRVPLDGSAARPIDLAPGRSVGSRSGDGPVLAPDGRTYAFQMNGALWTVAADALGRPAGPPRKLADVIPHGLSWSADSRTLLAQTGGVLRLYRPSGGAPRTVRVPLTWAPRAEPGVTTIHAGRLVDGVRPTALRDVDIVVERGRIREIRPHGRTPPEGRFVDASGLTVMPGLMDMHVHLIRAWGSSFGRLQLAYGITSLRSPGNVPGDILEEKEATAAGRRPGPNLFVTGYILDGERTVWEMGSTVATPGEARRQVRLGAELGYDMIKSYVHTSEPVRQAIVEAAHAAGLPVSSHDIYPAALFGSDSVEHLDGNNAGRGYAGKASQLNVAYGDVVAILAAGGMAVTPTIGLFTPAGEIVDKDPTLAAARWRLQPSWVREAPVFTLAMGPGGDVLAENIRRSILRLHRAGVKIVAGTDGPFTPMGLNTHVELAQHVRAGMTPFEALRSATIAPAELVGAAADLGTVEPGKIADLVFVEGDPLEDIANASRVRKVMKTGRLWTIEELLSPKDHPQ